MINSLRSLLGERRKCSTTHRSSRLEVFCKKGVLRNSAKFTGEHLCQSLFFNNVAGLRPTTLLKKRLWCVFLWILWNFYEHLFLQNNSGGCLCTHLFPPLSSDGLFFVTPEWFLVFWWNFAHYHLISPEEFQFQNNFRWHLLRMLVWLI